MSDTNRTFSFEQECCTKQNIEKVHFRWTIENFSHLEVPTGEALRSCDFNSLEHIWYVKVFPNGEKDEDKDYLSLFVYANENKLDQVKAKINFFILNPHNGTVFSKISYTTTFNAEGSWGWGFTKFVLRSDLLAESKGYLVDDKLRLGLELIIIKDVETGPLVQTKRLTDEREAMINVNMSMTDYSEFMNNKELSDVEIVNQDGEALKAHKVVLARNSVVLATTFKHPMKETNEGRVVIDKIRSEVLTQMLKFMYSAKLEENTKTNVELLSELLFASDLYEITQLKTICETFLLKNMTVENVIRLFELGETFRCPGLREAALDLIGKNEDALLKTPEWKKLLDENPSLANLVFAKLLNLKLNCKRKAGKSSTSTTTRKKRKGRK